MTQITDAIRTAAREDLANLTDPVGLQRAALETIADGRCDLDHARYSAGQCRDAVLTRRAIEQYDYEHETIITDTQIETLRDEAASAGDNAQVELCDRALDGDDDARAECERVIRDAEAQDDDPAVEAGPPATPHTLIRVDTDSYGWIVSQHATWDDADAARDAAARGLPPDAMVDHMWVIVPRVDGTVGERVRY